MSKWRTIESIRRHSESIYDVKVGMNLVIQPEEISFDLRANGSAGWHVIVLARLRLPPNEEGALLIIEHAVSLHMVEASLSNAIRPLRIESIDGKRVLRVAYRTVRHETPVLRLVLEWNPLGSSLERKQAPCLVLPDMLPMLRLDGPLVDGGPSGRQTRLSFLSELPAGLSAGGVSIPDRDGGPTDEFLQNVVFVADPGYLGAEDLAICVENADSQARPDAAYEYAAPLLAFAKSELRLTVPIRPVMCLIEADHARFAPPLGAFCPIQPGSVAALGHQEGRPVTTIRLLAQSWFAAGVRILGENADQLSLALGGALGLRWLREMGEDSYLQRVIAAPTVDPTLPGGSNGSDIIRAMERALFRALEDERLRKALGALVEERWGTFLPQSEIIQLVRRYGGSVPLVFE